ncbi:uncharacterized protein LOC143561878 [Bidens hawaiensis]|uniref:uncharacterized protein LOC143561878 n=1 Tax=Bidens hawaiensis TaxID=980011 RepID=UPI00404952FA
MTAAKRYARMEKSLGKELAKNDAQNDVNKACQGKRMSSVWSRLNNDRESATFEPFKARQRGRMNAPQTNASRWTPLTKSSSHIMYSEGIQLKKPAPIKQGPNTDMKSYCDFHEQHGHTTNQCVNLKDAIKEYVKNGKLDHLVRNIKGKYRRPPPRDGGRPEKKIKYLHANMISGNVQTKKRRQTEWPAWKEEQVIFPKVRGGANKKAPLVITAAFGHYRTPRFFVDAGEMSNIMYRQCFDLMEEKDRHQLTAVNAPIAGFNQSIEYPLGQLTFPVELRDGIHSRTKYVDFLVMETPHPQYDIILGREAIGDFNATPSTAHGILGVQTPTGIAMIHANKECNMAERKTPPQKMPKTSKTREVEKWVLNKKFPEQSITIGLTIFEGARVALKSLLLKSIDVFSWTPVDMTGVPRNKAEHELKVKSTFVPVVQKRRKMGPEQAKACAEQVQQLIDAGIIREIQYQTWFKCFLDAYKGYHQIHMATRDQDKTAFRTNNETYCYKMMPFGLKNAGSTYQRLMDREFKSQIGRNLEVYMDDLVVKSKMEAAMLKDIEETFETLRSISMKLNPGKCSIGMEEGEILGVVVKNGGFRANPEKLEAVIKMPSPKSIKQKQTLNGRLVALNRFLSSHAEKSFPFVSTLRNCLKRSQFRWTKEAEKAFQEIKARLAELPTLTAPKAGETLLVYLAASERTVSAVLMVERDGAQTPIYYISRTLVDAETRYSTLEKLVLSLVQTARRLRIYFQGHPIHVLTNFRLQNVLSKPELSGRLAKWAIELGEHAVEYKPRPAIKGQVLADFIAEIPQEKEEECKREIEIPVDQQKDEVWKLFIDGASNDEGEGAGLRITNPEGQHFTYAIHLEFKSTNNEAEYEALLAGLRIAKKLGAHHLEAHVDSMLVANQIEGSYDAKDDKMASYLAQAKALMAAFTTCKVKHINRSENKQADALSKLASVGFENLAKDVRIEVLTTPSIMNKEVFICSEAEKSLMTPIINYLARGILPQKRGSSATKH